MAPAWSVLPGLDDAHALRAVGGTCAFIGIIIICGGIAIGVSHGDAGGRLRVRLPVHPAHDQPHDRQSVSMADEFDALAAASSDVADTSVSPPPASDSSAIVFAAAAGRAAVATLSAYSKSMDTRW